VFIEPSWDTGFVQKVLRQFGNDVPLQYLLSGGQLLAGEALPSSTALSGGDQFTPPPSPSEGIWKEIS